MQTLVIYDNDGYIIATRSGDPTSREPVGVPFIWIEIPQGKKVVSVDTTTTPHKAILEDLPLSEIELLRVDQARANAELVQLIMLMSGGKHL